MAKRIFKHRYENVIRIVAPPFVQIYYLDFDLMETYIYRGNKLNNLFWEKANIRTYNKKTNQPEQLKIW